MTLPSDNMLNSAWNDLGAGREPDTAPGLDPTDEALLQAMHVTAGTVRPDPAFRDQLWADLSRRPIVSVPTAAVAPSLPASQANRSGVATMTPRLAPTGRRWSPPIATIAAALVIALVGYGALSLSGANPTGLNLDLNKVPNASAQGQGMTQSDNPVVGTWGWMGPVGFGDSVGPDIYATLTLGPDGTVIFTPSWDAVGHGTWTADDSGRIQMDISWIYTSDYYEGLEQEGMDETRPRTIYPALATFRVAFKVSNDGQKWEDQTISYEVLVRDTEYSFGTYESTLFRITDLPPEMDGMDEGFDAQRLDRVIDEAPGMTSAEAGLESSSADDVPVSESPRPLSSTPPNATPSAVRVQPTAAPNATQLVAPTPTRTP